MRRAPPRGDLGQVQVHRLGVAAGQDEGCSLPVVRADGAEDIGRGGTLIAGRTGRVPRLAQRRVILFFWPIRASSANQISIVVDRCPSRARSRPGARGNFFKILDRARRPGRDDEGERRACDSPWRAIPGSRSAWRRDAELLEDPLRQIDKPPAHDAMDGWDRSALDHAGDGPRWASLSLAGWPGGLRFRALPDRER